MGARPWPSVASLPHTLLFSIPWSDRPPFVGGVGCEPLHVDLYFIISGMTSFLYFQIL